jgi:hypothetical protein
MSLISGSYSRGSDDIVGAAERRVAAVEKDLEEELAVRGAAVKCELEEAMPAHNGVATRRFRLCNRSERVAVRRLLLTADMVSLTWTGRIEGKRRWAGLINWGRRGGERRNRHSWRNVIFIPELWGQKLGAETAYCHVRE